MPDDLESRLAQYEVKPPPPSEGAQMRGRFTPIAARQQAPGAAQWQARNVVPAIEAADVAGGIAAGGAGAPTLGRAVVGMGTNYLRGKVGSVLGSKLGQAVTPLLPGTWQPIVQKGLEFAGQAAASGIPKVANVAESAPTTIEEEIAQAEAKQGPRPFFITPKRLKPTTTEKVLQQYGAARPAASILGMLPTPQDYMMRNLESRGLQVPVARSGTPIPHVGEAAGVELPFETRGGSESGIEIPFEREGFSPRGIPSVAEAKPAPARLTNLQRQIEQAAGVKPLEPNVPLREQPRAGLPSVAQDTIKARYPDTAERQMVRANGEKIVQAVGGDKALMKQVHDLDRVDLRQAAINGGIDMGQRVVSGGKFLGEGGISREGIFNQLLAKGYSPRDIVKLSAKPLESR